MKGVHGWASQPSKLAKPCTACSAVAATHQRKILMDARQRSPMPPPWRLASTAAFGDSQGLLCKCVVGRCLAGSGPPTQQPCIYLHNHNPCTLPWTMTLTRLLHFHVLHIYIHRTKFLGEQSLGPSTTNTRATTRSPLDWRSGHPTSIYSATRDGAGGRRLRARMASSVGSSASTGYAARKRGVCVSARFSLSVCVCVCMCIVCEEYFVCMYMCAFLAKDRMTPS